MSKQEEKISDDFDENLRLTAVELTPEDPHDDSTTRLSKKEKDRMRKLLIEDGNTEMAQAIKKELIGQLNLERQYNFSLQTLKELYFIDGDFMPAEGNATPPSFEEAMETFTPAELEIASHFQKPVLLLVPEMDFKGLVTAIDNRNTIRNKISNTTLGKTYIYESHNIFEPTTPYDMEHLNDHEQLRKKHDEQGQKKIHGWRVVIADGAQNMTPYANDDVKKQIMDRVEFRQEFLESGEKGMDRMKYLMLAIESLSGGKPIDQYGFTMLDDENEMGLFDARWNEREERFEIVTQEPDAVFDYVLFRSSVGGEKLMSQ